MRSAKISLHSSTVWSVCMAMWRYPRIQRVVKQIVETLIRLRRLIWAFDGRACNLEGNVPRLKYPLKSTGLFSGPFFKPGSTCIGLLVFCNFIYRNPNHIFQVRIWECPICMKIKQERKKIRNTVEPQWLEHLWDHGNSFETWVVRATED